MAFSAGVQWEVRTTGNDANGGGFNAASTGTDYSQSDTPLFAYNDLVIGATNTQLSSVARPFITADVGNIINIISGTGFTVQRVQITSVALGIATCDNACGTASSTAGAGNLGGGVATIGSIIAVTVPGNIVWVQTGTYSISAQTGIPANSIYICGYSTTHGDDAAKATFNFTASSGTMFTSSGYSANNTFKNIKFACTVTPNSVTCIGAVSQTSGWTLLNCDFSNFSTALACTSVIQLNVIGCTFDNLNGSGIVGGSGAITPYTVLVDSCYFNCNNYGIEGLASFNVTVKNSIFYGQADYGLGMSSSARNTLVVENCVFMGIGLAAVQVSVDFANTSDTSGNILVFRNNIMWGNTRWGLDLSDPVTPLSPQYLVSNNAVGSNPSGNYQGFVSQNDVTLTTSPFVGPPNFSLNSTPGGGAGCKGAGWPGAFPGATGSASTPDIGACQSSGSSGGSVSNFSFAG